MEQTTDVMLKPIPYNRTDLQKGSWAGEYVRTLVWNGLLMALEPISHSRGNVSNITEISTEKVIGPDGSGPYSVPIISGNQMASRIVRRSGADFIVRELGLKDLNKAALQLIYNGGTLQRGGHVIHVDEYRKMCRYFPLLSLLGGALGNVIEPSKMKCDNARLVCEESKHLIPKDILDGIEIKESYALRQVNTHTRQDVTRLTHYQKLMPKPEAEKAQQMLIDGIDKTPTEKKKKDKSILMPYERESVAAGSFWHWSFTLEQITTREFGAFMTALAEWKTSPYLGGRSSRGYGKMKIVKSSWLEADPSMTTPKAEDAKKAIDEYVSGLKADRDKII